MPTFVQILDFIGTFAFAISGIRLASAKRFDWFGAYVVKAPYPSAQYILYIRHHRSGTVYGGGRGQEPGAGLSFLGGHYHGQHHRSRGRCDTRCVYQ